MLDYNRSGLKRMERNGIIALVVVIIAAYFLYEPVMDRYFTDISLKVSEAPEPFAEEEEIHLQTDRTDLTFSTFGGRITSAQLKNFQTEDGQPVELISNILKTRSGIRVEIPQVEKDLDDRPYHYERNSNSIEFIQKTPEGLEIRKVYTASEGYSLTLRLNLTNHSPNSIDFPEGLRIIPFFGMHTANAKESKKIRLAWMNTDQDHPSREKSKKIKEPAPSEDPVTWIGIQNRYFTQVFVPLDKEHQASLNPLGEWQVYAALDSPPFILEPGQSHETSYLLYLGPTIEEELKRHHAGLEKMVDYGTFELLGKGVLLVLRWIHGYISNYGYCMILLALVLRILLFPLTQYNLRSLREMPRILQEIYDIEEEEKENPERSEARTRPLRKKQVRSMIGSFVPLAVQIPIFLALYQVLNASIELRGAEFIFWVKDLSVKDPLFLLPVFMGLGMILQQRLTSANPKDDKTWIWMPLGFALLFSFFPAGLVLFWLTDTLFSVVQLAWIAAKPGAERPLSRS